MANNLKGEFFRKLIHISSAAIPIAYYFSDKKIILTVLLPVLFLMLSVELLKYKSIFIYDLYIKFFNFMLKNHEVDKNIVRLNGASWVLLGDTACIILFPKLIAITGMLILSLADSFSAVFGKLSRGKEIVPDRTVPGTIAFFLVALIISFLTPKYFYTFKEYSLYIAMAVITTAADFIKLPVDDNLTIPIVSSGVLYISYLIFFPGFL